MEKRLLFVEATGCVQQIRQVLLSLISGHLRGANSTSCGSTLVDPAMVVRKTGTGRDQTTTMTFSFRPRSSSRLPPTAASVRTRVVSWKEAAEMKDSVLRDALVIPIST